MRRAAAGSVLALCVAGCAPTPLASPAPPSQIAVTVPPAAPAPPPSLPAKDACGAAALQGLIGHPRTEVPVPIYPDRQRVACTRCPITQDYRPERLNFFFDEKTGLIREIHCG